MGKASREVLDAWSAAQDRVLFLRRELRAAEREAARRGAIAMQDPDVYASVAMSIDAGAEVKAS